MSLGSSRHRFASFLGLVFAAISSVSNGVFASDSNEAIRLGHDGLSAYAAGDRILAKALFERAEKIAHSPVFVLYLARIARADGSLELALELYRELDETLLDESAPLAWKSARSDARAELEKFLETHVEVRFRVDDDVALPVDLDGDAKRRIQARLGTLVLPREAKPFGARDARDISLSIAREDDGSRAHLRISRRSVALGSPAPEEPSAPPPRFERAPPYRPGIYVSFGFTALFAVGGAAFGIVALDQAASVKSGCIDGFCRPGDFELANAAVRNADLSLVSLGIAGVSAITGTTLWFLSKREFRFEASPLGTVSLDGSF